jgi:hypothetical protein
MRNPTRVPMGREVDEAQSWIRQSLSSTDEPGGE